MLFWHAPSIHLYALPAAGFRRAGTISGRRGLHVGNHISVLQEGEAGTFCFGDERVGIFGLENQGTTAKKIASASAL